MEDQLMTRWLGLAALAAIPLLSLSVWTQTSWAQTGDLSADISGAALENQVAALTTLDELDVSGPQLKQLRTLAKDTGAAPSADDTQPKVSSEYHTALLALRDALVAGDDDKIDDAQDKVEDLRDSQNIDPDQDYDITDPARLKAKSVLKLLNSSQIANYIALHADEVPDATEVIEDALDQCKDATADDFASLRDEAADQVGMLSAGLDQTAAKVVEQKVTDLLNRARAMTQDQFDASRSQLDAGARQITRNIDSFEALHHWMLREMADLLSNPQTAGALDLRISADKDKG